MSKAARSLSSARRECVISRIPGRGPRVLTCLPASSGIVVTFSLSVEAAYIKRESTV